MALLMTQLWGGPQLWGGAQLWGALPPGPPASWQPRPNSDVNGDDLLDLIGRGLLRWTVEFSLLDRDRRPIGLLTPDADLDAFTVDWNSEQTIARTGSGFTLRAADADAIDPLTDLLLVTIRLSNGAAYDVGMFTFAGHATAQSSRGAFRSIDLFDPALRLDRPLDRTVAAARNTNLEQLWERLARDVLGDEWPFRMSGAEIRTAEPIAWEAGTSRYDALRDIARMQGCFDPYFDGSGVLVCERVPDLLAATADHEYGPSRGVLDESVVEADDSWEAPNRYLVTGGNGDVPVAAYFDVPADAPNSIHRIGYPIVQRVDVQGIESEAQAYAAAAAAYAKDVRSYRTVEWESFIDPRHGEHDLIDWRGEPYIETAWSLNVSAGLMRHRAARIWLGYDTGSYGL